MFAPHGSCSGGVRSQHPAVSVRRPWSRSSRAAARHAVDDVSFDVEEGELLVLLGPSGCGKTTTLRMIAGLEEPDAGEIWLGQRLVSSAERNLFVPTEKRNIGMVFQSYAIWPHMTVFDNVAYPLRVRRVAEHDDPREGRADARAGRAAGSGGALGHPALGRPAAARGAGPGDRLRAAAAAARRAAVSNLDAKLRVQMRTELKHLQQRPASPASS